jgi:hypothetical protein
MQGKLRSDSALADPDAFYAALIAAHDGLSDEQCAALDARLILLLANQIGDLDVLREALAAARAGL